MQPYPEYLYTYLREETRSSAKVIVPLVMELIRPRSVVDVGCGTGIWLSVFEEHGIEDFLGIDGEWVSKKKLEIPEEHFVPFDLERAFYADRKIDLVVSLEVAEHLPRECAETLVDTLTRLGNVVLFSAAIPYQVGENHVNGQWPAYWMELFGNRRFVAID
jgi:SAM-dependent methyltransferase